MKATSIDTGPVTSLLRSLLLLIVEYPDDLLIEPVAHASSVELYVTAHAADTAKLIGKKSATYLALRTWLAGVGERTGFRVTLAKIQEPTTGEREAWKFTSNPAWPKAKVIGVLRDAVRAAYGPAQVGEILAHEARDGESTTLEVIVFGTTDDLDPTGWMGKSLAAIFASVGVTQGHALAVDVIIRPRPQAAQSAQPASAAGRFAKELDR